MVKLLSTLFSCFFLWKIAVTVADKKVASVESSWRNPTIVYPPGISEERSLERCSGNTACNLVHKRFWFPNLVERLCRCDDSIKTDCPMEWQENDGHTMFINPRAQLKFCDPVTSLPKCKPQTKALVLKHKESRETKVYCYCNKFSYFQRTNFKIRADNATMEEYSCVPLSKCQSKEFCGHIIDTLFQTYYTCSCPQHHLCIMEDRKKHNVREVMFSGDAYKEPPPVAYQLWDHGNNYSRTSIIRTSREVRFDKLNKTKFD